MAATDETVLILGETGVGKDLLASFIHQNSSRRERVFVHLNCAALPEGLLESELFGHMRGSYTGATDSRPGQFEVASGGTLFLDEIGELPPRLQAKLLHVLQERKIYRVGGREPLDMNARIIAATNCDLNHALRTGAFRLDLFYRLSVVTFRIPPLRERLVDLTDLAIHFFRRYTTLYNRTDLPLPDDHFFEMLHKSRWEGNIRELENTIKRVVLLEGLDHTADEIAVTGRANVELAEHSQSVSAVIDDPPRSLKAVARMAAARVEREAIVRTLKKTAWNRRKAAQALQISYRALLYKIKGYALCPDTLSDEEELPKLLV